MRIFSKYKDKSNGILIPTRMYEIAIQIDEYDYELNFLEKAVKDLLKINPSINIIETLALSSIDDVESLITAVKEKLNLNKDMEQGTTQNEIRIFQFYQELYGGVVLPFVKERKDEKGNVTNSTYVSEKYMRFEIHGEEFKAFYKKPKNKNLASPTLHDIIRAINIHNQNSRSKISMITSLNLSIHTDYSTIYLHTDILFGKNGRFNIKSPFSNAFSPTLDTIFIRHCEDFISKLRNEDYIHKDEQIKKDSIIFNNELDDIRYCVLSYYISDEEKDKNLFNAYERLFELIIKKNKLSKLYGSKQKNEIYKVAKELKFNCNDDLGIFSINGAKNLQFLLATILFGNKETLEEIARNYPNFLLNLDQLLIARNTKSHGGYQKISVDKKELEELFLVFKNLLSNIVLPKEFEMITAKPDDEKFGDNNAYIDMEKEFSGFLSHFNDDDKDDLSEIYEIKDFDEINVEIFSKIVNNLYKVIERNLRKVVKPSLPDEINTRNLKLGKALGEVKEKSIKKALRGENASLGAYMLVYITISENITQDDLKFIEKLLNMRAHGNHTISHINAYLPQDLKDIRKQGIEFIKKILI